MEDGDVSDFVQRQQHAYEELLVLLLQWQSEAVDDGAEYLQQLCDAVVPVRLVDESIEDVVDGASNERSQRHEVAVDAVQDGLEVVPLSRGSSLSNSSSSDRMNLRVKYLSISLLSVSVLVASRSRNS